jgi:hypothetical protein
MVNVPADVRRARNVLLVVREQRRRPHRRRTVEKSFAVSRVVVAEGVTVKVQRRVFVLHRRRVRAIAGRGCAGANGTITVGIGAAGSGPGGGAGGAGGGGTASSADRADVAVAAALCACASQNSRLPWSPGVTVYVAEGPSAMTLWPDGWMRTNRNVLNDVPPVNDGGVHVSVEPTAGVPEIDAAPPDTGGSSESQSLIWGAPSRA